MYVTVSSGLTADITRRLAALLQTRRIPSFAMLGAEEVQNGLLLSMARADYAAVGRFHATIIARILRGESPPTISQLWREPARIALNFKTMRLIGFDPPMELLLAADDIFELANGPGRTICDVYPTLKNKCVSARFISQFMGIMCRKIAVALLLSASYRDGNPAHPDDRIDKAMIKDRSPPAARPGGHGHSASLHARPGIHSGDFPDTQRTGHRR